MKVVLVLNSLLALLLLASSFAQVAPVAVASTQAIPSTHRLSGFAQSVVLGSTGGDPLSESQYVQPPSPICSTTTSSAANVNTDCEGNAPHNEESVAVNPTNSLNIIASANDYQLFLTNGGKVVESIFSRAHVTFDGGHSWTTYPIYYRGYDATGDPGVAFDAHGTAYLSTVGFLIPAQSVGVNPDIVVAHSTDKGKTWSAPVRVAAGTGSFISVGTFNDKPYIAAWGDGNAIVTWTVFNDGIGGSYISSPIFDSVTHDGGITWTPPQEISGSASFCIGAQGGNACNQDQFSTPVVAADGSIYVAFENTASLTTGRDQYLVVRVDPATGQRVAGPYVVAQLIDGFTDYPVSIDSLQTLQDSQFRVNSAGNLAADPTHASHLAVISSDMRDSTLPAPSDPYSATTNADIVVSQSFDGGVTWSAPTAITALGDQFFPWGAYDANGYLHIGFMDRQYDPANHEYGYTVASETSPGSLIFTTAQVTTTLSDPTQGTRWFSGRTPNPDFPHPTTFIGDYTGVAVNSSGAVLASWTDLRIQTCFATRCGSGQDNFFGAIQ